MAKSALGRGLGSLMETPRAPLQEHAPNRTHLSPGMTVLVQGGLNGAAKAQPLPGAGNDESIPRIQAAGHRWRLQASLVLADALLLVLAGHLVLGMDRPPGIARAALCAIAVLTGAWLSCLALSITPSFAGGNRAALVSRQGECEDE